jgi:hypothetical protein
MLFCVFASILKKLDLDKVFSPLLAKLETYRKLVDSFSIGTIRRKVVARNLALSRGIIIP